MKDFQGYRQKKNNEFAQQKAQRLELRNGKEQMRTLRLTNPAEFKQLFLGTTFPARVFLGKTLCSHSASLHSRSSAYSLPEVDCDGLLSHNY